MGRRGEPTVDKRPEAGPPAEGQQPEGRKPEPLRPKPPGETSRPNQNSWRRVAGIGFDFAGAVGGFAFVGFWIGRHYGSERWGVLVGAVLGLIGGLYNLVRQALRASREMNEADERHD